MRPLRFTALLLLLITTPLTASECEPLDGADGVFDTLRRVAHDLSGSDGRWTAVYRDTRLLVFAVEAHGRMRAMAAIADADDLEPAELEVLLAANYGRALDAKFAIGEGVLWSLFNRPMAGLCHQELIDGIDRGGAITAPPTAAPS